MYGLFAAGVSIQSLARRRTELGATYVVVLGFEALVALALGVAFDRDTVSPTKVAAVAGVYPLH
jgi:hypothetical protein